MSPSDTSTSSVTGYTPAQIRQAYGFDHVSFGSGGVTADGKGQTIAIVDAYNDPNIVSDLKTFDTTFSIAAPPSFEIVSQTGSTSKLPSTDAGWAGEISLDVEWAHAIAPGANILLVEANSATLDDLMTAVNYARHVSGVSAISMSWGGSEFFSWSNGEFTGETQYDPNFTTPSGHQGITFAAAAGDSGSFAGVEWPAVSPNVLSVGGTSLYTNSDGSYSSETSWNGTSGGYSQIEPQPAYQDNVQTSGVRSTPDVSIVGDPNTGVAVYDSLPDQGYSGWQQVGGTSAGAPMWSALVAIANQGRVQAGEGTLDGVSQTLPILYSLYTVANYSNSYNDVVDPGSSNPWHWRWGFGNSGNQATAGYDTATGLGTPKAAALVTALIGSPSNSNSNTGTSGTNGNGTAGSPTPTPAQLPASPLSGVFLSSPPDSVMGGTSGSVRLRITNVSGSSFDGPVTVNVYLSTDGSATSGDTLLTTLTIPVLKLKAGASKVEKLKLTYPSTLDTGSYFLTAAIDATKTNTADATVSTARTISVAKPSVDLATVFSDGPAISVSPGDHESTSITIENLGNVNAVGTLNLNLYESPDGTLDTTVDPLLGSLSGRKINLRPGHSMTFKVQFLTPTGQAPGTYKIVALATSNTQPADSNSNNDSAVASTI
jgi:subtilase family serine protease